MVYPIKLTFHLFKISLFVDHICDFYQMKAVFPALLFFILPLQNLLAQNYQAMHGSSHAGSLGVHNNPASIVSSPLPWDIMLFGIQTKNYSNLFGINKLVDPKTSGYQLQVVNGEGKRDVLNNTNINLLNARFSLPKKTAISFGINIRSATIAKTSLLNLSDSVSSSNSLLGLNTSNQPSKAYLFSSNWLELHGTYAKTILENQYRKLNVGGTIKVNKGAAGVVFKGNDGRFQQIASRNYPSYYFTSAELYYGYSYNLETWNTNKPISSNLKQAYKDTDGGISMDLGLEYVIKGNKNSFSFDEGNTNEYLWKFGVSLLDLGYAKYKYGTESAKTSGIDPAYQGTPLENKFDATIQTLENFNDSLKTMVVSFTGLYSRFLIYHPTRLVLNVDRKLSDFIYINGELTLNISQLMYANKFYVRDMNLLTITPRIENRNFGFYLPLSMNMYSKLWIGAAFKAGPLLLGIHNIAPIKTKSNLQNGGGYLAFVISPYDFKREKKDKSLNCPK
jgi:hypothetical protein